MNMERNLAQYFRTDEDEEEVKALIDDFEEMYVAFYDGWKEYQSSLRKNRKSIISATHINFNKLNSLNDRDKVKFLIGQIHNIRNVSQEAFDSLNNSLELLELQCSNVCDSMLALYGLSGIFSRIDDLESEIDIHTSYNKQIRQLKEKSKSIYHQGYQDGYDMKVEELDDED